MLVHPEERDGLGIIIRWLQVASCSLPRVQCYPWKKDQTVGDHSFNTPFSSETVLFIVPRKWSPEQDYPSMKTTFVQLLGCS